MSGLENLIVLIRDRSSDLSNPIDDAVMGDARDALNGSKAHPVEGHFDAESLHFGAVSLRLRMLAELAAAVAAQIALSALATTVCYSAKAGYFATLLIAFKRQSQAIGNG